MVVMCYISRLPNDVLKLIFCKLPILSLKQCRCVCKLWQQILTDQDFANLHLSNRNPSNLFLCMKGKDLYWLEFEREHIHFGLAATVKWRPFSFFWSPDRQFVFRNSCNGLLCVCQDYDTMHIINPITGEYLNLPASENRRRLYTNLCGLGFDPETGKFKAVRVTGSFFSLEAEVCTIGNGTSWRGIRGPQFGDSTFNSLRAFVNGSLHCLCSLESDKSICAFDFQNENFRSLSLPHNFNNSPMWFDLTNVGVFRESLYICSFHQWEDGHPVEIWMMEEYGVFESWTKILTMQIKLYDLRNLSDIHLLEDGDILLHTSPNFLLYNPETRCEYTMKNDTEEIQSIIHPILHSSSLVSLEGIVGDCSEVYNVRGH